MAPVFKHAMKKVLGGDVGLHYPGPLPIQPIGVVTITPAAEREGVRHDRTVSRSTRRPASLREALVRPAQAYFVMPHGSWRMTGLLPTKKFSCHGVTVKAPTW